MNELKQNPLFHGPITGEGEMSYLLTVPGYPVFHKVQDYSYENKIVSIQGGFLNSDGGASRPWILKVRHPEYTDDERARIYIAWYEFLYVDIESAYDGRINFQGLMTEMLLWENNEPQPDTNGAYPFVPPNSPLSVHLPVPVKIAMYPRKWDKE